MRQNNAECAVNCFEITMDFDFGTSFSIFTKFACDEILTLQIPECDDIHLVWQHIQFLFARLQPIHTENKSHEINNVAPNTSTATLLLYNCGVDVHKFTYRI